LIPTQFSHRILIVDDEQANILFLKRLLAFAGYQDVITAMSGTEALSQAIGSDPDLILLDLHMPGVNGYEVLAALRKPPQDEVYVPILVFTTDVTMEARKKALDLGASDFLSKPGDAQEILLRVRNFLVVRDLHKQLNAKNLNLEQLVRERTKELEQSQVEILERLALAGERRDDDTRRVSELSSSIGREMGLPDRVVDLLRLTSRLHDLGKIGVPDSILLKPGRLTPEEFAEVKKHCHTGAKILSDGRTPLLQMAERIAQSHHERFDGAGYPEGLEGESIPIEARIVSVADVFDALTHVRPYKPAWDVESAIAEIRSQSGKQFDPNVVSAFEKVVKAST